jgi:iron complex outermembrane recepter protein
MKKNFYASVAIAAMALPVAVMPTMAWAQSSGSIDIEDEIIVTAQADNGQGVEGVVVPDSTKAKAVLTEALISKQSAGQSIVSIINQVPGVNFTNSDAYGSSGGNLRIRGFDGNRISLTFDGFPLNDTGNYAIFSNQQLDPELVSSVNVNLGTTDVDSPTASAAGGTVNYLTRTPGKDVGGLGVFSLGEENYTRLFGMVETGEIFEGGPRAFVSASRTKYDKFRGPGEIYKQQYNAKIYQSIGDNGDFITIAGHYNQNRNNFYRAPSLADIRLLTGNSTLTTVGGFTKAQQQAIFDFDNLSSCTRGVPGVGAQNDNGGRAPSGATGTNSAPNVVGSAQNNILNTSSCTNFFGLRINPSNTGNVRMNSRWTLTDNLRFTVDAMYQYVLANGGGTTTIAETAAQVRGASPLAGVDYNGDGDTLDTIRFYTPNTTQTHRYTALTSLIWDVSDMHRVRLAYTFDRGRHRQTGEWGYLDGTGNPENVFGGRNGRPVLSADGVPLRQRDRLSYALLNQLSGQYIGKFFEDKLRVEVGVRMPFFKRDLNNFCFTQATGSGFATCTSQILGTTAAANTTYIVPNNFVVPTSGLVGTPVFAPFKKTYKFSPVLPSVGANYKITDKLALFASYTKGFSAPRTDNLYRAPVVNVDPETTNAFDLGLRYTDGNKLQAQATVWTNKFKNRIVTSFDQSLGISLDRNVGSVKAKGFDAGFAVKPFDFFTFQGNLSYNDSKLQDNIQVGFGVPAGAPVGTPAGPILLPTAGKRVTETPKWQYGYRAQIEQGPLEFGLQMKYVGSRFATDVNDIKQVSYATADMDLRFNLEEFGLGKKSWLQLNVTNIFDRFYLGNINTQIAGPSFPSGASPSFSIGAPRTAMGTLRLGF